MLIQESFIDLSVTMPSGEAGTMRTHIFRPVGDQGSMGGICLWSEIYQVTGPVRRLGRQLASEGFIVAAPEVYHEFEPPGKVLEYNEADTNRGNELKVAKPCSSYDRDAAVVVGYLLSRPDCNGRIGSIGMCLGGHLALRCALLPKVIAAVCLFATDVDTGSLGDGGDDSMARMGNGDLGPESETEMVMIWGRQDSHCSIEGRTAIRAALESGKADYSFIELNARHAFIRDELSKGRYDASLASISFQLALELFRRRLTLGLGSMSTVAAQVGAPGPLNC